MDGGEPRSKIQMIISILTKAKFRIGNHGLTDRRRTYGTGFQNKIKPFSKTAMIKKCADI